MSMAPRVDGRKAEAHLLRIFVDDFLHERLESTRVRDLQQTLSFHQRSRASAFLQERRKDVFRNLRRAGCESSALGWVL